MTENKNKSRVQEELRIKDFPSSLALKEQIRLIIERRESEHWDHLELKSVGPYLTMIFMNES